MFVVTSKQTSGPVGASVGEDVEVSPPLMKKENYLILRIILKAIKF